MASEIRVNSLTNRSGLSTVSITDTGAVVAGIVTATSFSGPLTGDVTGNVTGDLTGNVTGNTSGTAGGLTGSPSITVTDITATGNVSIGGTLTYDDVTNIDSVGVVTARNGLHVTGGHIGVGVIPESWSNNLRAVQIGRQACVTGQTGANIIEISANAYHNSGWKYIESDTATSYYQYQGAHVFSSAPSGTADNAITFSEKLRITSSGNIGIGTDSPDNLLHLSGTNTTVWPFGSDVSGLYSYSPYPHELQIQNHARDVTGSFAGIYFHSGASPDGSYISAARIAAIDSGNYRSDLAFGTRNTNFKERLRIRYDGNVGIDENAPNTRLHIVKDNDVAYTVDQATQNSNNQIKIENHSTTTDSFVSMAMRARACDFHLGVKNNGADNSGRLFLVHQDTTNKEVVSVTSAGDIGIGVINPDLKLHVNGVNALPSTSGSTPAGHLTLRAKATGSTHGMFMGVSNASPWSSWIQAQDYNNNATNYPLLLNPNGGNIGIGTDNPGSKLTIYETGGNAKLQLQRANTANNTDDYGSILWRSAGGTAVGGINVARATAENDGYMFFQTTESGSNMTERLRILSNGTIRKGSPNSAIGKQPIELFFQKRSTQIGKRIHQGSGVSATTHNILNIDSWQSANSHAFIYVTVYYVSPVTNYGGRMECYATAVNSGGNVSGGQGTFATSDAGRWGNPGVPSLSWSGSTLRFTTLSHAYIDYSLDITCIAYDGAVVSFYSN